MGLATPKEIVGQQTKMNYTVAIPHCCFTCKYSTHNGNFGIDCVFNPEIRFHTQSYASICDNYKMKNNLILNKNDK